MTQEDIKKNPFGFLKNVYFAKFYGRKYVFGQILRIKNLCILIKSVRNAGLYIPA